MENRKCPNCGGELMWVSFHLAMTGHKVPQIFSHWYDERTGEASNRNGCEEQYQLIGGMMKRLESKDDIEW